MLRSTSTLARLTRSPTRRTNGRPDVPSFNDHQGEVLGAPGASREPAGDARLLLRAPAAEPPGRQARRCRRRHGQEAPATPDPATGAEPRQARRPGPAGTRRRPRGPGPAGPGTEVRRPAAASGPRFAGAVA